MFDPRGVIGRLNPFHDPFHDVHDGFHARGFGPMGGPPGGGPMGGGPMGGPMGGGPMRGRGGRRQHGGFGQAQRGSVKYDILAILWEGPRHGYDLMLAIEDQRGYRPSPGSIYPALQFLEDGDFVAGKEIDGKRVYTITDKGSELLAKHRDEHAGDDGEGAGTVQLIGRAMQTLTGIKMALKEIGRTRDIERYRQAAGILDRARKDLFMLVSGDEDE